MADMDDMDVSIEEDLEAIEKNIDSIKIMKAEAEAKSREGELEDKEKEWRNYVIPTNLMKHISTCYGLKDTKPVRDILSRHVSLKIQEAICKELEPISKQIDVGINLFYACF